MVQSTPLRPIYLIYILFNIIPHLHLCLPNCLIPSHLPTKTASFIFYPSVLRSSPIPFSVTQHLNPVWWRLSITSSSLGSFLRSPATCSTLGPIVSSAPTYCVSSAFLLPLIQRTTQKKRQRSFCYTPNLAATKVMGEDRIFCSDRQQVFCDFSRFLIAPCLHFALAGVVARYFHFATLSKALLPTLKSCIYVPSATRDTVLHFLSICFYRLGTNKVSVFLLTVCTF